MNASKLLLLTAFSLVLSSKAFADERGALPQDAPSDARGWIGAEERNGFGLDSSTPTSHVTQDYGADLLAGIWLLNEHIQPIVDLGWSDVVGIENGHTIQIFRGGGRVAFGCALSQERFWIGAAAGIEVQAGWFHVPVGNLTTTSTPTASSSTAGVGWAASPSISGLMQGRVARRLLLGLEVGVEHSIPALAWEQYSVFHAFRLELGIEIGVILGKPISKS